MSMRRQIQLRKGTVSLSVFKGELDGKVMVSLDKDFVSRRVKGPLFSEDEMYDLVEVIRDYDELESKVVKEGRANRRLTDAPQEVATSDLWPNRARAATRREVEQAIQVASSKVSPRRMRPNKNQEAKIIVLPTLPEYRYLQTCPKCGNHVQSTLRLGGTSLKLCPSCDRVHKVIS